jgi:hypothetical protein
MEKRINKKLETYITDFKQNLRDKLDSTNFLDIEKDKNNIIQYIYEYERLNITKEDFSKRKRVKNMVPLFDRCCAKRASDEQCTRKKRCDSNYCGTHDKNRPHGEINECDKEENILKKVEIWIQEINGIVYYIDGKNNIYKTEDILCNSQNPSIIAKYVNENGYDLSYYSWTAADNIIYAAVNSFVITYPVAITDITLGSVLHPEHLPNHEFCNNIIRHIWNVNNQLKMFSK